MSQTCHRSGKTIYAADKPINFGGLSFLPGSFTCNATGTKLTLGNAVKGIDGEVYLRGKEPLAKPTNVASDVHTEHAKAVQKHEAKKFNVMGDEKFTSVASDVHTEHAKAVQKHEQATFNVMGDEKFTSVASDIHTEHAKAVQKHETKKFDAAHDHTVGYVQG